MFSYSLLCYSNVTSDFIPLNWIKIVEIQIFVPKQDILLKFGGHFEKSALTALSSTGIFAGNLISIALWLGFPKGSPLPDLPDDHHPTMDNITVCQNGVIKLLRNLKPFTASGPDGIPTKFLKETAVEISPAITLLFQASFDQGRVPPHNGRRFTLFPSIGKEVGLLQQTTAQSLWLQCCANYVSIYFTVLSSVTSPTMRSCRTPSMGSGNGGLVTPNWLSPWKTWPKDLTTNHKMMSSF